MADCPVFLQPFKKSYCSGEEIVVSFSLLGFFPSLNDQIGIFTTLDKSIGEPLSYQYVLDSTESLDGTNTVSLKINFVPKDETSYEVRYFTEDGKVLLKSSTFQVTQVSHVTSLLTIKEGTLSDDDLILIDKIKPSGISLTAEGMDLIQEEIESTETNILADEIEKRKTAEHALEILSRKLADQVALIAEQGEEIIRLKISCDRGEVLKECLKEEYENLQDNVETFVNEMEELRVVATNYKIECTELNKKAKEDDELLLKLKCQVMDDKEEYEVEVSKIKNSFFAETQTLKKKIDAFDLTLRTEVENLKELHKCDIKRLKKENKLSMKEMEKTVRTLVEEKNDLELKLQREVENKTKLISDYEKSIHDLESRVANEASNAGRLENEIKIAENRTREAVEDTKFFRQNFLDTEKKLQVSQSLVQKYIEELKNLKNSLKSSEFLNDLVITDIKSSPKNPTSITACSADKIHQYSPNEIANENTLSGYSSSLSLHMCKNSSNGYENSSEDYKNSSEGYENTDGVLSYSASAIDFDSKNRQIVLREFSPLESNDILQPITVLIDHRRAPITGKYRFNKQVGNSRFSPAENKDYKSSFTKNISDLDRYALERQYQAIRLHRNSLIRENSFLKNTADNLRQDIIVLNQTVENLALDAEMKIGMLQVMLGNQSSTSTIFIPDASNNESFTNENNVIQSSLSPFASEYTPSMPMFPLPLFVPPPPIGFYEFMAQQFQNSYLPSPHYNMSIMQVASQNEECDVSEQLTEMGIKISNV